MFYKKLFIAFFVVGSFLATGSVLAADCNFCCCNNGTGQEFGTPTDCSSYCSNSGGVQLENAAITCGSAPACNAQSAGTTGSSCSQNSDCQSGSCVSEPETGDNFCAGSSGDTSSLGTTGASCSQNSDCQSGSCVSEPETGDNFCAGGSSDTLPTGGSTNNPTGNSNSGPSSVQMPNFSGVKSLNELFLKIVQFLMVLIIPFAVIMIIWSGFLFATAQGDPTKITKARNNFLATVVGVAIVLASEAIIGYVSELLGIGGSGQGMAFVERIKSILNEIIAFLFILVTVYFFWGIITYVRAAGDQKAIDQGKKHMLWGIIGMSIMAGAWGIVEVITSVVK